MKQIVGEELFAMHPRNSSFGDERQSLATKRMPIQSTGTLKNSADLISQSLQSERCNSLDKSFL